MGKISSYAAKTILALTDYVIGNDATGPTTKRFLLSDILTLFLNNIPAAEGGNPFVSTPTGLVWSGDAYASTRAASMTSGRVKVNSTFLAISAVTARVFTASKDTYVDVLDNLDGTGTLVYTEVTNNAASPALASNSVRIAIIVTGASNIAAAGSINQGQLDKVLPIASSIPYTFTDSLGNIICPRDPNRKMIGYRQITSDFTATTLTAITGLNLTCIPTAARPVKVSGFIGMGSSSVANSAIYMDLIDVTNSNTVLAGAQGVTNASGDNAMTAPFREYLPGSSTMQYKAEVNRGSNAATVHTNGSSTNPNYIMVEQ